MQETKVIDWPFPTLENPLRPTGEKELKFKFNPSGNVKYNVEDVEDALL